MPRIRNIKRTHVSHTGKRREDKIPQPFSHRLFSNTYPPSKRPNTTANNCKFLVSAGFIVIVTRFIVIDEMGVRPGGWTVADTQRSLFSKCLARRMHYAH